MDLFILCIGTSQKIQLSMRIDRCKCGLRCMEEEGKKKRRGTNVVNYNILTFVDGNNLSAIPVLNSDV